MLSRPPFLAWIVFISLFAAATGCFGGGGGGEGDVEGPVAGEGEPVAGASGANSEPEPSPTPIDTPPGSAGSGPEQPPVMEPDPEPVVDPEPVAPATEPFAIAIEPDICELDSSITLTTADGTDITPQWSGCWITWSGETGEGGTTTSGLRVMIMPPNVTGSLAYPGARWLSISIPGGDPGSFSALRSRGYEGDSAGVVFVDTDDPDAAGAIDIDELLNRPALDTTLLDGINWSGVGGAVQLTSLSGNVTAINPAGGFIDDSGLVDVAIDLAELTLSLLDGTEVQVSGTLRASGQKGSAGGTNPATGEPPPPADCDQLWGLPNDIQVYSQCQTACVYADSRNLPANQSDPMALAQLDMAIEFSCAALEGFDPSYRAACPFCM